MTVTISFPADLEDAVRRYAATSGQGVDDFVLQAVQEKIAKARTFDEVSAPFADAIAKSAIGEDEFDRFFEEARDEVWRDKQRKKP
jgi:hypothetical protein